MAKSYFLITAILFVGTGAFAADYSTQPCMQPAELGAEAAGADYHSPESAAGDAIADEIRKGVHGELTVPLQNYSVAAPEGSKLYVGDVDVSGGQVSFNGVDLSAGSDASTPPPCVIELKPVQK